VKRDTTITLEAIEAARRRIREHIFLSPCAYSETLSRMTGCDVHLKLENLQMTGSFKDRGALNKILQLDERQKRAGVITASAGNHAQGVAHAAALNGIRATIVMPETTPLSKVIGTRELGAEIILHGSSYDAAYQRALELQTERGSTFIHAFDDPAIIAGQGTIGLELLEQIPDMEMVIVPVGGGGLLAGIATALKTQRPEVELIGVEAERLPAMKSSLQARRITPLRPTNTLADGIAVARVGECTLPLVSRYVSKVVTVSEEEIANAVMTLLEKEKTLAEGAGAAGFAALCNRHIPGAAEKKVVLVISGGNIDMTMLSRILERGLELDGRLARLKVVVPDKPGSIAELARLLAEQRSNILQISQNRAATEVALEETEVELLLETRGNEHVRKIVECIRGYGLQVK
jgi:threonine dehydratase